MILDNFALISADVVARMASYGLPPLVDLDALSQPACLLGPENAPQIITSACPRITFVPLGGEFTKRAPATGFPKGSPLYAASIEQPWAWTDVQRWRVDIAGVQYQTGVAVSDLRANWDWPSAMLYTVVQSLTALVEGSWKPVRYEWVDSKPGATKLGAFGRLLSMYFELYAPVLVYNLTAPAAVAATGLPLVPPGTTGTITITETGGSAGDTITITVPGGSP